MLEPAPMTSGFTVAQYFGFVSRGLIAPDDRVELLEGVVVSMAPQQPRHAGTVAKVARVLHAAFEERALVRTQLPLVLGEHSVPEPDAAVVPLRADEYVHEHPRHAHLVVEVADSSLAQDRLTKAVVYAAAGIPEYWIINVRDEVIEVMRDPERARRLYRTRFVVGRDGVLDVVAIPGVTVRAADVLPPLDEVTDLR